jgi:hypothetical protein
MSLIKSADVPKHIADRLRSRRLAARLAGSAPKESILPAKGAIASPAIAPALAPVEPPTTGTSPPSFHGRRQSPSEFGHERLTTVP